LSYAGGAAGRPSHRGGRAGRAVYASYGAGASRAMGRRQARPGWLRLVVAGGSAAPEGAAFVAQGTAKQALGGEPNTKAAPEGRMGLAGGRETRSHLRGSQPVINAEYPRACALGQTRWPLRGPAVPARRDWLHGFPCDLPGAAARLRPAWPGVASGRRRVASARLHSPQAAPGSVNPHSAFRNPQWVGRRPPHGFHQQGPLPATARAAAAREHPRPSIRPVPA